MRSVELVTYWYVDALLFVVLPLSLVIAFGVRRLNGRADARARRSDELLLAVLGELQDRRR